MLDAVERHYGLAHRWFEIKAGILGLDRLELHDQYAPIGAGRSVDYPEARRLIDESFGRFSPRVARLAGGFFEERRIDAEPRPGKRGGAFCAPVAQDASPYVLMNFTDRMDDVMTLAHELGHGMHFTFASAEQTALSAGTGIALAEVPSTFAELLAFDHLLGVESDPATRRALVSERVEGSFATVFRQTVLTRYEQRAYALRADGATLTPERLSDIWIEENRKYYGDSLVLPEGYRCRLVVHPPLHLDPLLHLRLRVRAPGDARAVRAIPRAGRVVRRRLHRLPLSGRVGRADRAARGARRGRGRPGGVGTRASARWSEWWGSRRRDEARGARGGRRRGGRRPCAVGRGRGAGPLVRESVLGRSVQGRAIHLTRVGDPRGPPPGAGGGRDPRQRAGGGRRDPGPAARAGAGRGAALAHPEPQPRRGGRRDPSERARRRPQPQLPRPLARSGPPVRHLLLGPAAAVRARVPARGAAHPAPAPERDRLVPPGPGARGPRHRRPRRATALRARVGAAGRAGWPSSPAWRRDGRTTCSPSPAPSWWSCGRAAQPAGARRHARAVRAVAGEAPQVPAASENAATSSRQKSGMSATTRPHTSVPSRKAGSFNPLRAHVHQVVLDPQRAGRAGADDAGGDGDAAAVADDPDREAPARRTDLTRREQRGIAAHLVGRATARDDEAVEP